MRKELLVAAEKIKSLGLAYPILVGDNNKIREKAT